MKDRLKLLRNTLHLTQEDLAARIGVKRNSYANYETGRYRTNDAVVHCICREFRVSETWLRTGEGEMFLPEDEEQQLINWAKGIFADESAAFQRRFVLMLSELTPSQWNTLRDVACMIAGLQEKALTVWKIVKHSSLFLKGRRIFRCVVLFFFSVGESHALTE